MANYNKQFNFRNGVQVDNDNFIVSPTGLVGIGTTIPTESLDVRGDAKIVGLATVNRIFTPDLTATTASISNLTLSESIIGGGVSISSGIITASGAGVVTYYGDGGRLLNLPTSQWLDIDVGLGFTSIYAQGYVGVNTTDPRFAFQVSGNTSTSLAGFSGGLGINTEGDVLTTGIVTASKFVGVGSDLTGLNASSIAYGTISNDRIPVLQNSKMPADISISGTITAPGGLIGGVTGNVTGNLTGNVTGTASTALSLNGTPDIVVGFVTASDINVQDITSRNINSSGIVTSSSIDTTDISASSVDVTGNIGGANLNITGIITSSEFNVGTGGTIVNITSDGRVAIGSDAPTRPFEIVTSGISEIELVGTESRIILAEEKSGVSISSNAAEVRYGNSDNTFELVNYAPGNFNFYLHSGVAGIDTGRFNWVYGQNFTEVMSLTYDGKLGVGKTNPDHNLHVVGTSTVTGNAFIGGDLTIAGTLYGIESSSSGIVTSNINALTGVSTFNDIIVQNVAQINSIGIGSTSPIQAIDAQTSTALFSQVGLGTTAPRVALDVYDGQALFGGVGIGTTNSNGDTIAVEGGTTIISSNTISGINSSVVLFDGTCAVGVGTTSYRSSIDFGDAGKNSFGGIGAYMIVPILTSGQITGLSTYEGAIIFNTTNKKFQGYDGTSWQDFH